jgi:CHAT domain-containing protein/tetratricopeptide (TPR) repeat protein
MSQACSLAESHKYDSAIVIGKLALDSARQQFGEKDTTVVNILDSLGSFSLESGSAEEAEAFWSQALGIREVILGPEHEAVARSVAYLAEALMAQNRRREALELNQREVSILEKTYGPDSPEITASLHNLANGFTSLGMFEEAEPLFVRLLSISEPSVDKGDREGINVLISAGRFYRIQGKYDRASLYLERASAISQEKFDPDDPLVGDCLFYLGILRSVQGSYRESERLLRQALAIRETVFGSDHAITGGAINSLAVVCWEQCRFEEAEMLLKRALQIIEKTSGPNSTRAANSLGNLGLVYDDMARYAEAEEATKRALSIFIELFGSEHPSIAACYNNLGMVMRKQGRYAETDETYAKALAIREKIFGPNDIEVARILHNLANNKRSQGEYDQASPLYERSLKIRRGVLGEEHHHVGQSMGHLAANYVSLDRHAEAESLYVKSLSILENVVVAESPDIAITLSGLKVLYAKEHRYAEAQSLHERELKIWESAFGAHHPETAKSLLDLARFHNHLGEYDAALLYYQQLCESRQRFIGHALSYASENQKMSYIRKYPLIEHSLLSLALADTTLESHELALEMVLRGKAAVIDAISAEKEFAYCSHDNSITASAERHDEVCGGIAMMTLASEKFDPDVYRDSLEALYSAKDSIEAKLSAACTEFKGELELRDFELDDVVSALDGGSALLEIVRYQPVDFDGLYSSEKPDPRTRYLAFTVDPSGEIRVADLGEADLIDSLVTEYRNAMSEAPQLIYEGYEADAVEVLATFTKPLYEIVFAPLEKHLGDNTRILVSPDGLLNLLPFEILPCPDGKFAIEKYHISYLSSGRDLLRYRKQPKPGSQNAIVVADPDYEMKMVASAEQRLSDDSSSVYALSLEPLRGSEDKMDCLDHPFSPLSDTRVEGESIRTLLTANAAFKTSCHFGSDATEEAIKAVNTPPTVLHLATHGYLCPKASFSCTAELYENPLLYSGLVLAGANRSILREADSTPASFQAEDGVLTSLEVSGLNLVGTELVVLSACQTGLGEIRNGEGVFGLRRAFQHAGTRSVIMSLWPVPDRQTRELMQSFYENWLSGRSKSSALRQAAVNALRQRWESIGSAHPLFWGGFVLVGDPE